MIPTDETGTALQIILQTRSFKTLSILEIIATIFGDSPMNLELHKVYLRYREGIPNNETAFYAYQGFRQFGCEIASFEGFGDVEMIKDLGPEVGLFGYIGDVHAALKLINKSIPKNVDYPEQLRKFLGRKISQTTLGEIRQNPGKSVFIKPVEHKLFSGFVWNGDESSRRRVVTCDDFTEILACEPVEILSEYRSFILDDEILDCRLYKGDWSLTPNKEIVVTAVSKMQDSRTLFKAPRAYCLDWGITSKNETILIEMNEGYAFGHYGLRSDLYVRMLAARWNEMTK